MRDYVVPYMFFHKELSVLFFGRLFICVILGNIKNEKRHTFHSNFCILCFEFFQFESLTVFFRNYEMKMDSNQIFM